MRFPVICRKVVPGRKHPPAEPMNVSAHSRDAVLLQVGGVEYIVDGVSLTAAVTRSIAAGINAGMAPPEAA